MPEGFNLIVGLNFIGGDKLIFMADDKFLRIVIYFEKEYHSAKSDMQEMIDDNKRAV